ncbi:MAG: DUF58 domain-containing protein [Planctomyces sp.]|nr:DUF58 domain-containing protein [Planctomyces sp.]
MSTSNPGDLKFKYLQQADLRRLEQLLFAPRRVIEGRFSGQYATRQRGQSIEFRDYRSYFPGDEITAIDWKVYGRTDRLYIKLFEHQSELTVHLILDASASMAYQGISPDTRHPSDSKFDYACRLAAAIGFLIVRQHDRFSFSLAQAPLAASKTTRLGTSGPTKHFPPGGTLRHLAGVLEAMEQTRPRGNSGLATVIHELARRGRRRELAVIFSDLLDDSDAIAEALATRVHHGGEAVVIHVLHPDEVSLPNVEHGIFVDSETGGRLRLDVQEIRESYAARMQEFLKGWEQRCARMGVDYFRAESSEPYWQTLERYLLGRAAIGR